MNERIAELKRKRSGLVAEMKAIVAKETDENPLSDGDKTRFDEIKDSIDQHDQRIGRLEDMVSAESADSSEVNDGKQFESALFTKSNVAIDIKKDRSHEPKGTKAARFLMGAGLAKQHGLAAGVQFVRDSLQDAEVAKALNATGTSAGGGVLVPQAYRAEIIDLLWAETVVRSAGPEVIPMPMGQITIPRLSTASQAAWIGEQLDIPSNVPTFDQIVLSAKKLAGIVPVQNDLIRRSPIAVESIVRSQMVKQLARAEDAAFLTGTGSSYQPKGLANWALTTSNSLVAPTLTQINQVLSGMSLNLQANNISTAKARFFINPAIRAFLNTLTDQVGNYFFRDELNTGKLFGIPYSMTTNLANNLLSNGTPVSAATTAASTNSPTVTIPTTGIVAGMQLTGTGISAVTTVQSVTDGTHLQVSPNVTVGSGVTLTASYVTSPIILAAMDQVLLGDTMELYADSSDVASYFDGSAVVSSYQRDQTLFRCIIEIDLAVMHPAAVTACNVFGWLPTGSVPTGAVGYTTQAPTYPASPSLSAQIV